jgi:hypothetical protein
MIKKEAREVLKIMLNADGGCANCASALFCEFAARFPEHTETVKEVWNEEWSSPIYNFEKRVEEERKYIKKTTSDNGSVG